MADSYKITAVTGKGGVGKSLIALSIAKKQARESNEPILLVELGERSYFSHFYNKPIGYEPIEVEPNLFLALWDGENCLREFLGHYIKLKKVVDLFFKNKVMKAMVKAAPALKEVAILGKLTSGPRKFGPQMPFKKIVLDGYASGHFVSLLKIPKGVSKAIKIGPMGEQSRSIAECVANSEVFEVILVAIPEDYSVKESEELHDQLKEEFGIQAKIVCNKWMEIPVKSQQLDEIKNKSMKDYLSALLERHDYADEVLSKVEKDYKKVPLIYSADSNEVLKSLEALV